MGNGISASRELLVEISSTSHNLHRFREKEKRIRLSATQLKVRDNAAS